MNKLTRNSIQEYIRPIMILPKKKKINNNKNKYKKRKKNRFKCTRKLIKFNYFIKKKIVIRKSLQKMCKKYLKNCKNPLKL